MKRKCKRIDITDFDTIRPWVDECIRRHKKRYDFRDLLIRSRRLILRYERTGTMTEKQAKRLVSYKGFYKYSDYGGNFKAFKTAQGIIRKEAMAA